MSNIHRTSTYRMDFEANNRRSSDTAVQSGAALSPGNWFEKSWRGGAGTRQQADAPAVQDAKASTNVAPKALPANQGAKAPNTHGQVESMAQLRLRADLDSMCRFRLARYRTTG